MTDDQTNERDMRADDDAFPDPNDSDAASVETATDDNAELEEKDPGGRPRWPVIIGLVLLLAAIGVGLGLILPSGPLREIDQMPPALATMQAGAPTALPLPVAIEGDSKEVIATVGEAAIYRGDFVRFYQPGSDPQEVLEQLIQIELIVQAAAEEGISADETVVSEQIERIKETQANGDDAQFEAFLKQQKIGDLQELRRLLERDQVVEAMILRHTPLEQVRARHILIATDTLTDTAAVEAARVEAEGLMARLDQGADFAALAAEHSDDEGSRINGGDLGWAPRGLFVEPFDQAVFSMARGERRLVQSQFGWHIIEVVEPAEVRPLASSDLLQTQAGQQAFVEKFLPFVDQLRTRADEARQIKILVPAERLVTRPGQ
ncbi:MAG: peptidylprolyl isomerase [Oscillochloridaceae bacterium]|nr:peptidylprolyl isomerase [Chloroflexaceae bacterium]MDW8389765.1 peptidylprolyl isomerase [Oscillochloridaceae bacterium]